MKIRKQKERKEKTSKNNKDNNNNNNNNNKDNNNNNNNKSSLRLHCTQKRPYYPFVSEQKKYIKKEEKQKTK